MNVTVLGGKLASDLEVRTAASGSSFTTARLAVLKTGFNVKEDASPMFINLTFFGRVQESLAGYKKGSSILVRGKLDFTSKKQPDGTYKNYDGVVVEEVLIMDRPRATAPTAPSTATAPPVGRPAPAEPEVDLSYDPFAE